MCFIYKLFLLLFTILLSNQAVAVTPLILDNPRSIFYLEWTALIDPHEELASAKQLPAYSKAKSILLLGDEFENKKIEFDIDSLEINSKSENSDSDSSGESDDENDDSDIEEGLFNLPLAETVQPFTLKDAKIYKTSISCPEKLSHTQKDQIHYLKMDHTTFLPFQDNQMDTIIMRRGLCFCHGDKKSCGGLDLKIDEEIIFFKEIIRVLNKKNPEALISLSGALNSKLGLGSLSFQQEKLFQSNIKSILEKLEKEFPSLTFEMIYVSMPLMVHAKILKIKPFSILGDDGKPVLNINLPNHKSILNQGIRILEGIRIKVKSN